MKNFDSKKVFSIFQRQIKHNPWYGRFADELNFIGVREDLKYWELPYISVDAFKKIDGFRCMDCQKIEAKFLSSGTGNSAQRAKHYIRDLSLYKNHSLETFYHYYPKESFAVFAFLPAYSDNPNSSLVQMLQFIIDDDDTGLSAFLDLKNPTIPSESLAKIKNLNKRIVLFGAAFGLVDIAEKGEFILPADSLIIETGGMKTHRKEMTRDQIKEVLASGFGIKRSNIHSEYGMCELLSQAYETGDGWYSCPPTMKVFARPFNKPFSEPLVNEVGQLYVIDLVNEHSCSFIQLKDQGVVDNQGRFQVLGRVPTSELRGCNYLMEQN
jgi:hypothetical protein